MSAVVTWGEAYCGVKVLYKLWTHLDLALWPALPRSHFLQKTTARSGSLAETGGDVLYILQRLISSLAGYIIDIFS